MQAQLEQQGAFDEAHVRPAIAKLEELQRTQQRVDEKKEDIPSFALSQEEKTLLADVPGDLPDADEGTEILDSVYMRSSQNSQPNSDTSDVNSRKER